MIEVKENVNGGSISEKIESMRQQILEQFADDKNIILPLLGKHSTNYEEEPFDLTEKIANFLEFKETSSQDPKVMLLMGNIESGQHLFLCQLYLRLWKEYKNGNPIPLWISLSDSRDPYITAVEEVLKNYRFTDSQIVEIRAIEKFIFIVDGYDKLTELKTCFISNDWSVLDAKIVIPYRSDAFGSQEDFDKLIMPSNDEEILPTLVEKIYLTPFSRKYLSAYCKSYQNLYPGFNNIEESFLKIPGLSDLILSPFLMYVALEVLADLSVNQSMTQTLLYDKFIERIVARQIVKISEIDIEETNEDLNFQVLKLYKEIALKLHNGQLSLIRYHKEFFCLGIQKNNCEQVLLDGGLLQRYNKHFMGFIHSSMVEYFAARAMIEEIQSDQSPGRINHRLFSHETNMIRFLADHIVMNATIKQKMLVIVEASKNNPQFSVAAANAITALVRAGISFNSEDLSGINIAGADISGGYFDAADLSRADLRNTRMHHVRLRGARLIDCGLAGVNLGEAKWFENSVPVRCFDYREDIKALITGGKHGSLGLWSTLSGEKHWETVSEEGCVTQVKFSPDGKRIVLCGQQQGNSVAMIFELATSVPIVLLGHADQVTSVQFSPDGAKVVSASKDQTIRIWDTTTGSEIAVLLGHEHDVYCAQFVSSGKQIISGSSDCTIRLWDVEKGDEIAKLQGEQQVYCIDISPNGKQVVSGCSDNTIRIWEISSRNLIFVFRGHCYPVYSVQFSPDGKRVASGSADQMLMVWDVSSENTTSVSYEHSYEATNIQFSRDGERIIWVHEDGMVRIRNVMGGCLQRRLSGHEIYVSNVAFSVDGKQIVSCGVDKTVRIWDVAGGQAIAVLSGHNQSVMNVVFSSDGRYVLSGNRGHTIRVWEFSSLQLVGQHQLNESNAEYLVFSRDAKTVAIGDEDNVLRVWEIETLDLIAELQGHENIVSSLSYSTDGKKIVLGCNDGTVKIWSFMQNEEFEILLGHENKVDCLAFSLDGLQLVSGDVVGKIFIWDVAKKESLFNINAHVGDVTQVQFTADSKRIVSSGGSEKSLKIWDIATAQCLIELKLSTIVVCFSYDSKGLLAVGLMGGNVECWENLGNESNYCWKLKWSTDIYSRSLNLNAAYLSNVKDLSDHNRLLMEQRGAIVEVIKEAESQSSSSELSRAALISKVAKLSRSPIHQSQKKIKNVGQSQLSEEEEWNWESEGEWSLASSSESIQEPKRVKSDNVIVAQEVIFERVADFIPSTYNSPKNKHHVPVAQNHSEENQELNKIITSDGDYVHTLEDENRVNNAEGNSKCCCCVIA